MKIRNVMSLFHGMGCFNLAAERAGIEFDECYTAEIDKYASIVDEANNPNNINMGDVTKWREWAIDWSSIDLVVGGSPCQGFSFAGGGLAFNDPRSALFFEYLNILNHVKKVNPDVKFLLENVKMKREYLDMISNFLKVEPEFINSAKVSAQNRQRYYWANWEFQGPQDKGILLSSILEELPDCPVGIAVREKSKCVRVGGRSSPFGCKQEWDSPFQRISKNGKVKPSVDKAACLTGRANSGGNHSDMDIIHTECVTRRYSITECERLQSLPDGYTQNKGVSNSQCYKMLGNGWTADVIAHIFKSM